MDVNVHPAKREVRFRDPASVREAIVEAVQRTLESGRVDWQRKFNAPAAPAAGIAAGTCCKLAPDGETTSVPSRTVGRDSARPSNFAPLDQASRGPRSLNLPRPIDGNRPEPQIEPRRDQQFQIIGVLNRLYVLMENSDGLVLVDQHAAHERILFEELRRRMEEQGVPSQRMLLPQIFSLPPRDAEWVERNVATLQKMGIGVENFGANSFRVDTLPAFLEIADAAGFLRKVIDESNNDQPQQFTSASGRRHDRENRLPSRRQSQRSVALSRNRETNSRFAGLRSALLLSPWPAHHDPNFARRTGKKIRAKSLE